MSKRKKSLIEFVCSIKLPDRYASNIGKCVNLKDCKIGGLKSHDLHVLYVKAVADRFMWIFTQRCV